MPTLGQRLAKRIDAITSGVPSFIARVNRDALISDPGSDDVLGFVDASVERLTILD
ncbi:hypothetical protein [Novipirellula herctigrandis]|uniref:hypothetical protein n=1 Tax=Novipirellula herctigrandis TaxID=2527986 RepID=UPI003AF3CC60